MTNLTATPRRLWMTRDLVTGYRYIFRAGIRNKHIPVATVNDPEYAALFVAAPALVAAGQATLTAMRDARDRMSEAAYDEWMTPAMATAWDALQAALAAAEGTE